MADDRVEPALPLTGSAVLAMAAAGAAAVVAGLGALVMGRRKSRSGQ
ncbi:LPXTG cell wall anchor domain-containing protein [Nocardiopsis composta]